MKRIYGRLILLSVFILPGASEVQGQVRPLINRRDAVILRQRLKAATAQYQYLMQRLPAGRFPVSWKRQTDALTTSGSEPWVGGFYPGTLLYLYEASGDTACYLEALKKMHLLEPEQFNTTTHDLGFMMYCSFGNANRLHPNPGYKKILLNSARSLATRFSEQVGCIRSWDSAPDSFMVIIDNMVNLELLFAATRISGDSGYYRMAVAHANTTLQNHFRSDYSSYHLVIYDPVTGKVLKKRTVQGAADHSAWSRGQAWGLYGYTMTYRETGDPRFLRQAKGIADYLLDQPNLPEDKIPYWDFDAPGIPEAPRDVSAAAITASALLELAGYGSRKDRKRYRQAAVRMLRTLSSPTYQAAVGQNGGFILAHGVGNFPRNSDIDVPLIYADYYYVEALTRALGYGIH